MKPRNRLAELVAARGKRVPPNNVRRTLSPQPNRAIELLYVLAMQRLAEKIGRAVHAKVDHLVHKIAKKPTRMDAGEDDEDEIEDALSAEELEEIEDAMIEARAAAVEAFEEEAHAGLLDTVVKRTELQSKSEFRRLGIDVRKEPVLGKLTDRWRTQNVDRITSVSEDQLSKVEDILREGFAMRPEELAEKLFDQIDGVTKSRLEFIARDQTLKLHGQIVQHRQRAAGIEKYIWTTSNDERVRPMHDDLEGETCDWDDPPEINEEGDTGHPGDDYQCRCTAFPILPELDDDDETEGGGDDDAESDDVDADEKEEGANDDE